MRRLFIIAGTIALTLAWTATAPAAVEQIRDSEHRAIETGDDLNICGDLATFTFEVTSRFHAVDNGTNFASTYNETFRYTLVFDDPALGSWTGHGTQSVRFGANRRGTVFHDIFNSKEGPVQIIVHLRSRTDADGNLTVDRTYERIVGC